MNKCDINIPHINDKGGVYSISEDNRIIYVGHTMKDFKYRWEEHIYLSYNPDKKPNMPLYKHIYEGRLKGHVYNFNIEVNIDECIMWKDNWTKYDYQLFEYSIIQHYH